MRIKQTEYWTVYEVSPPLPHAKHHWMMSWHEEVDDLIELSYLAKKEFWEHLAWLRDTYELQYYCLGYRFGTGVEIIVGDPQADGRVEFTML